MGTDQELAAPPRSTMHDEVASPWAWAVLVAIFAGLIVMAVAGNAAHSKSTKFDMGDLTYQLKTSLMFKQLRGSQRPESYNTLVTGLKSAPKGDTGAALLRVAADRAYEHPVDRSALTALRESKRPLDKALAKFYEGQPLDQAERTLIRASLPRSFLGRLVSAQVTGGTAPSKSESGAFFGVIGAGAFLTLMGLAALVVLGFLVANGNLKPLGHPMAGASRATGDRLAWRMVLFMVAFVSVPALIAVPLRGRFPLGVASLVGDILFAAVVVALYRLPVLGVADPVERLVGNRAGLPKMAMIGFLGFVANLPLTLFLAAAMQSLVKGGPKPTHPLAEQLGAGASPITLVAMFLMACVMAPLLEELSFRGTLFPALAAYMKPGLAMVASGLLFASIHPQGPMLWPALASVGAVSACLSYYSGSLVPSIVMHGCHNAAIMALGLVMLS